MEYALRIATPENASQGVAGFSAAAHGEGYTEAPLTALYFGTEFCQELIPGSAETAVFCANCAALGRQAVLLTPMVTYRGLKRLERLFGALAERGWSPDVVFNDWGVFELCNTSFPALPLRMGRLLNRGLRDPRLNMRPAKSGAGKPASAKKYSMENLARGAGIRQFAASLGVCAVESDADLEPGFLGDGSHGLTRTLHLPYTFAASGRMCLDKAATTPAQKEPFTRGLKSGCSAPCRGICRREYRQDTNREMWRAGNTLFFKTPAEWIPRHLALADRVVFHPQPMP